jgi:hypothetical protein
MFLRIVGNVFDDLTKPGALASRTEFAVHRNEPINPGLYRGSHDELDPYV